MRLSAAPRMTPPSAPEAAASVPIPQARTGAAPARPVQAAPPSEAQAPRPTGVVETDSVGKSVPTGAPAARAADSRPALAAPAGVRLTPARRAPPEVTGAAAAVRATTRALCATRAPAAHSAWA